MPTMRNSSMRALLRLACAMDGIVALYAESETAVLFGLVKDPSGGLVPGAKVQLRNESTGATRELVSDDKGLYYFTLLPPGTYEFNVEASGFKQYRDSHVRVQVAQVGR